MIKMPCLSNELKLSVIGFHTIMVEPFCPFHHIFFLFSDFCNSLKMEWFSGLE